MPPDSQPPEWDYHVALAYKTSDGQWRVLDPVVTSREFHGLEVAKWFGLFEVPPGAVWTALKAEHYLFYRVNILGRNEGKYFNGNFFDYTGASRDEGYIPAALARDAVGMRLLQKRDCVQLAELRAKPAELLTALQNTKASDNLACQAYLDEFQEVRARWSRSLDAALGGPIAAPAQLTQPQGEQRQVDGIDVWTDILPSRPYETLVADVRLTYGQPAGKPVNAQQVQEPVPTLEVVVAAAVAKAREQQGNAVLITTRSEPIHQQFAQQGMGHSRPVYRVAIIRYTGAGERKSN